jgi:RNA polymerase-interacting CarD/CdnL/TRCF family regulator
VKNVAVSASSAVVITIVVVTKRPMIFEVGDQVVHPQHGLGQVVKLEVREFESGVTRQYYEISMPEGSTVWVPVDMVTTGLRRPAERREIDRCREILISRPAPLTDDTRVRQANLSARLKQGTIFTFCEIVRDLYAYGEHKSLYGTIAGFFRVTKDVLCQEWALVEGITLAEAVQEIDSLLETGREAVKTSRA